MRTIPPPVLRSGARQSLFLLTWQQPEAHSDTHLIYQRPAEAVAQGGGGGALHQCSIRACAGAGYCASSTHEKHPSAPGGGEETGPKREPAKLLGRIRDPGLFDFSRFNEKAGGL